MSILIKTASLRKFIVNKVLVFFMLAGFALSFAAPHAGALGIDLEKIPKVMNYDKPSEQEFAKASVKVEEAAPYGDDLLGYSFYVPKGWTGNLLTNSKDLKVQEKQDISDVIFSMLGKYIGHAKNLHRSYVTVEGQKLGYEVKALHWFVSQILTNGLSLAAVTEISDKEVEGLYVQIEKDQSYVVRARAIINGDKLIVIRHYLPQENYEEDVVEQAKIISSFKLLKKSNDTIEKHVEFGFLDQSYFDYPASWRLKEKPILTVERMSALLYQEKMQREQLVLEGHVRVNAISRLLRTSLSKEVKDFKESLDIPKYSIGKLIEKISFKRDLSISMQQTEIYELLPDDKVNMRPYELLVSVMQSDDYYYILSMISPSRDHDFFGWAKNREVAKIMIESMRRYKVGQIVDPSDPYYDYLKEAK